MKFKSRKDLFFTFVIYTSVVSMLALATISFSNKHLQIEDILGTIIIILSCLFILWLFYGTYYVITSKMLHYHCGPIRGKIALEKITSIHKGKTMWVGLKPATAKKGLIIKYNTFDEIYISPQTNELFLKEILNRNPSIKIIE